MTMCGKTTTSRRGRTGRVRIWDWERAMGAPGSV
jgi:hypothetical protein